MLFGSNACNFPFFNCIPIDVYRISYMPHITCVHTRNVRNVQNWPKKKELYKPKQKLVEQNAKPNRVKTETTFA